MENPDFTDPIGQAIMDRIRNQADNDITILSPDFEDDIIPVDYLFRTFTEMPVLEKKALSHVSGKTLDVGAGAGSHTLYLQQQGIDVTAIDTSPGAVEGMIARGVKKVFQTDIMLLQDAGFNTIFFLMNGIGLSGTPQGYLNLLQKLKQLLAPNGYVIFDTSDIRYLFDKPIPQWRRQPNNDYYGIVSFQMKYKNHTSLPFDWLYIDENMAARLANASGFAFELLGRDEHYGYLARLLNK